MSEFDDSIPSFLLPPSQPKVATESFAERLRRRRDELSEGVSEVVVSTWQSRAKILTALVVESPHASAVIVRRNADAARAVDGIAAVLFASDLPPFQNSLGQEFSGEPLLAEDEVHYRGQPVALVVGKDADCCREAIKQLEIEFHPHQGILTIEHALAMASFHESPRVCERGNAPAALKSAPRMSSGSFLIPPQQSSLVGATDVLVAPLRSGRGFSVRARALSPTLMRTAVARTANIPESDVELDTIGLAGMTDALEAEPVRLAMLATRAALTCGSPVVLKVMEHHSPLIRGQRHAIKVDYEVGFQPDGTIVALDIKLDVDGGFYPADSATVMDRATLHADSVYAVPNFRITSRLCRTNRLTSSGLPAEGSAQGSWAMEEIIRRVATESRTPALDVRERNFYTEGSELKTTPYGQPVSAASVSRVWHQVMRRSELKIRSGEIEKWNKKNPCYKRGLGIVAAKFGLGDPRPERDAAAVLVQILADGSVLVRVGVVDVNDGLDGQIREEVASRLGIEQEEIRVILNDFDVLPRSTPVIGADATGLILRALGDACRNLQGRLREVALQLFASRGQTEVEMEAIRFSKGLVGPEVSQASPLHFKEVVEGAWRKRVNLVETGYHRTPNLWWDHELGAGWPFSSFTYAAAVAEIQVDAFTGEVQILRLDIAHEGSPSPNQAGRDFAQLIRAFTLGAGWLLSEETTSPDHETTEVFQPEDGVMGFADAPFQVVTDRLRPLGERLSAPGDPCAEAPVLLAVCLREALWDALRAFGMKPGSKVALPFPASPPRVIATLKQLSRQGQES